eukprot:g31221.t1
MGEGVEKTKKEQRNEWDCAGGTACRNSIASGVCFEAKTKGSDIQFDWKLTEPLRQNRRLRFNVEQFQCGNGMGDGHTELNSYDAKGGELVCSEAVLWRVAEGAGSRFPSCVNASHFSEEVGVLVVKGIERSRYALACALGERCHVSFNGSGFEISTDSLKLIPSGMPCGGDLLRLTGDGSNDTQQLLGLYEKGPFVYNGRLFYQQRGGRVALRLTHGAGRPLWRAGA